MDKAHDDEGEAGEHLHPAERGRDRTTQARLAYRLQHIERIRESRATQGYWEQELAKHARMRLAEQREATRRPEQERARQRLLRFLARAEADGGGDAVGSLGP